MDRRERGVAGGELRDRRREVGLGQGQRDAGVEGGHGHIIGEPAMCPPGCARRRGISGRPRRAAAGRGGSSRRGTRDRASPRGPSMGPTRSTPARRPAQPTGTKYAPSVSRITDIAPICWSNVTTPVTSSPWATTTAAIDPRPIAAVTFASRGAEGSSRARAASTLGAASAYGDEHEHVVDPAQPLAHGLRPDRERREHAAEEHDPDRPDDPARDRDEPDGSCARAGPGRWRPSSMHLLEPQRDHDHPARQRHSQDQRRQVHHGRDHVPGSEQPRQHAEPGDDLQERDDRRRRGRRRADPPRASRAPPRSQPRTRRTARPGPPRRAPRRAPSACRRRRGRPAAASRGSGSPARRTTARRPRRRRRRPGRARRTRTHRVR